jgi:hypothetical protein
MTLTSLPPRAWLLIGLLILAGAGCTRRDWVDDLLVLTDVTGTWSGTIRWGGNPAISMSLQQSGARVAGETSLSAAGNFPGLRGSVQGVVNGEVFSFTIVGTTTTTGVLTVDGDEMVGDLDFPFFGRGCPCRAHLRRSGPAPTPRPQT